SVDCPVPEIYNTQIRNAHNRVFLFDSAQYESIASENPAGIFHLPLGAAAGRITAHLNATGHGEDGAFGPEDERYDSDVSFVGSLYNEKDHYLEIRDKLPQRAMGFLDALIRVQNPFPGLALIREVLREDGVCGSENLAEAVRKADPDFYDSSLCVRNLDGFWISDLYLGFHLTHLDRVRTLNLLAQVAKVDFYTRSDTKELSGVHCHGGVTSLDQMPIVFRRSRINLNLTMRSIETGLPQRIWDVLGAGGFLLTDARADLPENLVPGVHLETFGDEAELVEKVRYYLEHSAERETIARAGYEEVCRAGTVLHRVMEMVKIVASPE
ncbi:MAG: DUF3880 domain-containing protein, partial [Lachnospiraceae bacterium]|nr:DUF3880 domain-containing protein [Lachnospiraceae bacterium]